MKIIVLQNTTQEREECCNKTKILWLITPEVGAQNTTRLFEMDSADTAPT
jgi:hypothetical protein